ncbi:Tad domain-containing protein [Acinetobacter nectaris]|uniref:Tad domain-containing protein n=1 Tax=Acinetobacter nectaris TaxID=1219382 RepID=UPI001F399E40|nr:Tad domain-containing protein [Acinetobacter nectaris]MCF9047111.1 Tad domain-containing protein [Acinetobacter nectaris]
MQDFQKGQSTVLILVFSLILILTFIFVFNTSKMLSERQQIKMLADRTAYATATRQARLLNLNAYINRIQIANQLAIAQGVSTASWAKYASKASENLSAITTLFPPVAAAFENMGEGLSQFSDGLGTYIEGYGIEVKAIEKLQDALNATSNLSILTTPQDFVNQSSSDYQANLILSQSKLPIRIIKQYQNNERQRMADVVLSSSDDFITNRSKNNVLPGFGVPKWSFFRLHKAGGTELVNLNEWKGVDTLSLHFEHMVFRHLRFKSVDTEIPVGWGSAAISNEGKDRAIRTGSYGGASGINPNARNRAESNRPSWDVKRTRSSVTGIGIPNFYELSDIQNKNPIFPLMVSLKKQKEHLTTVNRNSNFHVGTQLSLLDNYDDLNRNTLSNGDMRAITTAEVYFQRPWDMEVQQNRIDHEIGSLFSPYWKVKINDDMTLSQRAAAFIEAVTVYR